MKTATPQAARIQTWCIVIFCAKFVLVKLLYLVNDSFLTLGDLLFELCQITVDYQINFSLLRETKRSRLLNLLPTFHYLVKGSNGVKIHMLFLLLLINTIKQIPRLISSYYIYIILTSISIAEIFSFIRLMLKVVI